MRDNPNEPMLKAVHTKLTSLDIDAVYVGGCMIPFYTPDLPPSMEYRTTEDVDAVILAVTKYADLEAFEEKIGAAGFFPPPQQIGINNQVMNPPKCRWALNVEGRERPILVDFLSPNQEVFGMNSQFDLAVIDPITITLACGTEIKGPRIGALILLKLQAFKDRGLKDIWLSKDLEDIVGILASEKNRHALREGNPDNDTALPTWEMFEWMAMERTITDAIVGYVPPSEKQIALDILTYIRMPPVQRFDFRVIYSNE